MLRLLLLTVFLCSVAIGQEPLVAFDGVLQPQPQQAPVLKIPKIQQLNWTAFWPNGEDRAKCPKKEVLEAAGKRLTSGWCLLDAEPILPHPTELAKLVDGVVEAAPKDCKIGVYIGWGYDRGRNGNLKIALDNFGPLVATAEALNGTKAYFISPDIYSYDDSSPENFASRNQW
jgi:hypothetical protein